MKTADNKEQVRKAIIDGANMLFLQYGCKKVTMDQIAQELHISKRTIYEQFEDKSTLLEACISSKFDKIHAQPQKMACDETPLLMMLASVQVHADTMNRHELMMRDLKEYYRDIYDKHIGKIRAIFVQSLSAILANDQKNGRIRPEVDPQVAANAVVAMALYEDVASTFGIKDPTQAHKILSDVIYTYMRGLLTESLLKEYELRREELQTSWRTMIDKHASECCKSCSEQ